MTPLLRLWGERWKNVAEFEGDIVGLGVGVPLMNLTLGYLQQLQLPFVLMKTAPATKS